MTTRIRATCDSCGKAYGVPDASRSYRCKACGGSLRATAQPEPDPPPTCTACGAELEGQDEFCQACGARQDGDGQLTPADKRERIVATRKLKRAARWLPYLRGLYVLMALFSAFTWLGWILAAAGSAAIPGPLVFATAGLLALITLALVAGAVEIARQPFALALVIALLVTLLTASSLASGDLTLGLVLVLRAVILTVLWGAVLPMVQVRKLARKYPDLRGSEPFTGARPGKPPRPAGSMRVAIWTGVASLVLAATLLTVGLVRDRSFSMPEDSFVEACAAGDLERIADQFQPGTRDGLAEYLAKSLESHFGAGELPFGNDALTIGRIQRQSTDTAGIEAAYHCPSFILYVSWAKYGDAWWIDDLAVIAFDEWAEIVNEFED